MPEWEKNMNKSIAGAINNLLENLPNLSWNGLNFIIS